MSRDSLSLSTLYALAESPPLCLPHSLVQLHTDFLPLPSNLSAYSFVCRLMHLHRCFRSQQISTHTASLTRLLGPQPSVITTHMNEWQDLEEGTGKCTCYQFNLPEVISIPISLWLYLTRRGYKMQLKPFVPLLGTEIERNEGLVAFSHGGFERKGFVLHILVPRRRLRCTPLFPRTLPSYPKKKDNMFRHGSCRVRPPRFAMLRLHSPLLCLCASCQGCGRSFFFLISSFHCCSAH